ncbi:hypothetical protein LguiA_001667 [Lonicera macranthoides]
MEELELPEEIVFIQILLRLPVKCLLRCRCVCKHWRDWISEDASVQSIPQPWDGEDNHILYDLLGLCNGFVLIGRGRTILLWNPSTRVLKEVLRHENLLHCYRKMYAMTGLCYDSSTNDYKVILRFVGLLGKPFEFSSLQKRCWTKVDNDVYSNYIAIWGRNKGVVVNGNQHWLVQKKLKNEKEEDKNKFEEVIIILMEDLKN